MKELIKHFLNRVHFVFMIILTLLCLAFAFGPIRIALLGLASGNLTVTFDVLWLYEGVVFFGAWICSAKYQYENWDNF